MKIDICTGIEV